MYEINNWRSIKKKGWRAGLLFKSQAERVRGGAHSHMPTIIIINQCIALV